MLETLEAILVTPAELQPMLEFTKDRKNLALAIERMRGETGGGDAGIRTLDTLSGMTI